MPRVLGDGEKGAQDYNSFYEKTICMDTVQYNSKTEKAELHYNMHSMYGYNQAVTTDKACPEVTGKRCHILTRSSFPGSQKHVSHWLGDNGSGWDHLQYSIAGILDFSLFGFSHTGVDICGFGGDSNEELCRRWTLLGAFYPFSRNHNAIGTKDQDPAYWDEVNGDNAFSEMTRDVYRKRYQMMPYLYTLMWKAHTEGASVATPLWWLFPEELELRSVDRQLVWGSGFMIVGILEEGATSVEAYFKFFKLWFVLYGQFHFFLENLSFSWRMVRFQHSIGYK